MHVSLKPDAASGIVAPAQRATAPTTPSNATRLARDRARLSRRLISGCESLTSHIRTGPPRPLLGEGRRAGVGGNPGDELEGPYVKAVDGLDGDAISMLAPWPGALGLGHPVANKEFPPSAFPGLGDHRREALRIAAGFR